MIWRHHYQSEKNGDSTAGSRRKRPDYLHIHNFFFLSFNDFKKWKRSVSPSQRIKTNCTAGGGQKPFSTGKILPKFSVIHKNLWSSTPQPLRSACLLPMSVCERHRTHTFQHIEQAHTSLPASPNSASKGARGGGRPAHQAPSIPAPPPSAIQLHRGRRITERGSGQYGAS